LDGRRRGEEQLPFPFRLSFGKQGTNGRLRETDREAKEEKTLTRSQNERPRRRESLFKRAYREEEGVLAHYSVELRKGNDRKRGELD